MGKISIIHATKGRTQKAFGVSMDWYRKAAVPESIDYIFSVDVDDPDLDHYSFPRKGGSVAMSRFPCAKTIVGPANGCNAAFNRGAWASDGEIIAIAADDVIPPHHWDRKILERIPNIRGSYPGKVLAVSDGHRVDRLIAHPILTRAYLQQQGNVFDSKYPSTWADADFTECAYKNQVVIEARDLVFLHDHPAFTTLPYHLWDERYRKQNSAEHSKAGRALFASRFPRSKFLYDSMGRTPG